MTTRELKIDVDKGVMQDLKMLLFQHGLYSLVGGEYVPKCIDSERFYDLNLEGLSVGSQHNCYRDMLNEVFGDKVRSRETNMVHSLSAYTKTPLPILYSVIQSALYREYGEFE